MKIISSKNDLTKQEVQTSKRKIVKTKTLIGGKNANSKETIHRRQNNKTIIGGGGRLKPKEKQKETKEKQKQEKETKEKQEKEKQEKRTNEKKEDAIYEVEQVAAEKMQDDFGESNVEVVQACPAIF
jgi:hypothetical protein